MRLSDLNRLILYFLIILNFSFLKAEDAVDIWKKKNSNSQINETPNLKEKIESPLINKNTITCFFFFCVN